MKKYLYLLFIALGSFLLGGLTLYAQGTSISGDSLCGSTKDTACNFGHLKVLVKGVMSFIIGLGLPLLIVVIAYRYIMAWFAAASGNASAYKEATKKAGQAFLGFMILVALLGGVLIVLLKYLGATDPVVKLLELISRAFVPSAYAQSGALLPSPVGDTNLYDFILKVLALVMRFFVYPALIVVWVWTGFAFVAAQGKPESLSKAKKMLMWATVSTFVIVMIQAFLIAAKGTVKQVLPGAISIHIKRETVAGHDA